MKVSKTISEFCDNYKKRFKSGSYIPIITEEELRKLRRLKDVYITRYQTYDVRYNILTISIKRLDCWGKYDALIERKPDSDGDKTI